MVWSVKFPLVSVSHILKKIKRITEQIQSTSIRKLKSKNYREMKNKVTMGFLPLFLVVETLDSIVEVTGAGIAWWALDWVCKTKKKKKKEHNNINLGWQLTETIYNRHMHIQTTIGCFHFLLFPIGLCVLATEADADGVSADMVVIEQPAGIEDGRAATEWFEVSPMLLLFYKNVSWTKWINWHQY